MPTVDDLRRFQQDGERLLRGFEMDLKQAFVAEKDPKSVTQSWRSKLDAFMRQCEAAAKPPAPPAAKTYLESLEKETKRRFEDLADHAQNAHERRAQVKDSNLMRAYDDAVSTGLSQAPREAMKAARGELLRAIRQLVDGVLPQSLVRSDQSSSFVQAKGQIAGSLTGWIEQQDVVEDAFFTAQNALLDLAGYLQRALAIHDQIRELESWTSKQKTLDPAASKKLDDQAAALGKAWNKAAGEAERSLRRTVSVKPEVRLDPSLVLDPSKRFLKDVNLRAGITIETSQIKIQLSGRVTITEPLTGGRQLSAAEELSVQHGPWSLAEKLAADSRGPSFGAGLGYTQGNVTGGVQYDTRPGEQAVKAFISIRF